MRVDARHTARLADIRRCRRMHRPVQIDVLLQIQPKLRLHAEQPLETQGGIRGEAFLPRMMALSRFRGTCIRSATSVCLSPSGFRNSSNSISPGVVGARCVGRPMLIVMHQWLIRIERRPLRLPCNASRRFPGGNRKLPSEGATTPGARGAGVGMPGVFLPLLGNDAAGYTRRSTNQEGADAIVIAYGECAGDGSSAVRRQHSERIRYP